MFGRRHRVRLMDVGETISIHSVHTNTGETAFILEFGDWGPSVAIRGEDLERFGDIISTALKESGTKA